MKKFLLFISCLLALGSTSNAQGITSPYEYTFVKGTGNYFTTTGKTTFNNVEWNLAVDWIANEYFNFDGTNAASQIGAARNPASKVTISTNSIPGTITGISIEMWQTGKATYTGSISIGGTDIEINNSTTISLATKANSSAYTASGLNLSGEFKIEVSNTNTAKTGNGAFEIKSIKIEFIEGSVTPPTVATPEISIDENDMVSISCETEGVDIYYTINGDEPTADSQKYDAPFELTATATVKAIAINGEDKSNIASKTFTVIEKKNTLENWTEWSQTGTFKITCPLTVIYKNGKNVYVKDADNNYALVFNQNNITLPDYQNGDVINGMTATFTIYAASKLPEIIPVTVGETTVGTPVEATEITAAGVNENNFFHFVSMSGVSIVAAAQDKNFTVTDKDGIDAPMYNQFNLTFTPEEGATYDVTGVIGAYKGTYQFQPIEIVKNIPTAIDEIGADVVDGKAEYFNLQGVKINPENATPGLYIRRQGGKVAKVVVK